MFEAFALAMLLIMLFTIRQMDRDAARVVADFQRQFPGRCLICAYHKFGVQGGYVRGGVPAHDCIEAIRAPGGSNAG